MQTKKLLFALLGSMLLPANLWSQISYEFKGTTLEKAKITPTSENGLNVSANAADSTVVYLYNPKTGRFIYGDGSWGTEAVGRYKGFGMPFNIVDPTSHNDLMYWLYFYDWDGVNSQQKIGGVGFYCEAYEHGHYLGRDFDWYVGSPVFYKGGVRGVGEPQNTTRFFVDRGGVGNILKTSGAWAAEDNIFTWHLEPVTDPNAPEGTNLYYISIYMPNQPWMWQHLDWQDPVKSQTFNREDFFKHYVKFKNIDPYGDPEGFYALTTTNCNAGGTRGEEDDRRGILTPDQIRVTSHEATPSGPDKEDYYWQIVTRKEIKQKFLLDQNDPYNAKVETGNATVFIDNPDFSRALQQTVRKNGDGNTPIYWQEDNDDVYQWANGSIAGLEPIFGTEFYGRYAFMHPYDNGTVTQEFKPSQYGLFRLDAQGYTFNLFGGQGKAYMKLEKENGSGIVLPVTNEVEFESISQVDALPVFNKIGDFARNGKLDYNDNHSNYIINNHKRHVENDNYIFEYAEGSKNPQEDLGQLIIPGYSDVYADDGKYNNGTQSLGWGKNPTDYSHPCLYRVRWIDKYGRVCKGIYINGKTLRDNGKIGPFDDASGEDRGYGFQIFRNGENVTPNPYSWGWADDEDGIIEVQIGDKVEFGPLITGNGAYGGDDRVQWWTPKDDPKGSRQFTIDKVDYDDAGDYIVTFHDLDYDYMDGETKVGDGKSNPNNKWNVIRYRLVVTDLAMQINTPAPTYVKFAENNDEPFLVKDPADASQNSPAFTLEENYKSSGPVGTPFYADQTAYQNGIAATDIYYVERAVGEFLYNPENSQKYVKSIFFYVPQGAENNQLKITLRFEGINDIVKDLVALDNVRLTYLGDAPHVLDEKNEKSTTLTPDLSKVNFIPVYMNRKFKAGEWNAFVCPIPLSYGQLKEAFGEGVKVSEINVGEALAKDDPYRIMFKSQINENTDNNARIVKPGHFYIVNPSSDETAMNEVAKIDGARDATTGAWTSVSGISAIDGNFVPLGRHNLSGSSTTINGTPYPSEILTGENPYNEGGYSVVMKATGGLSADSPYRNFYWTFNYNGGGAEHNNIQLHGSYFPQQLPTGTERGNTYIFAYKKTGGTDLIHLNETASNGGPTSLDGFRFYIQDVDSNPGAKPLTFEVDGVSDEGETTDITNAIADPTFGNGDVYTITGQKVTGKLTKGIYVKNGKKFLVR